MKLSNYIVAAKQHCNTKIAFKKKIINKRLYLDKMWDSIKKFAWKNFVVSFPTLKIQKIKFEQ